MKVFLVSCFSYFPQKVDLIRNNPVLANVNNSFIHAFMQQGGCVISLHMLEVRWKKSYQPFDSSLLLPLPIYCLHLTKINNVRQTFFSITMIIMSKINVLGEKFHLTTWPLEPRKNVVNFQKKNFENFYLHK